MISIINDPKAKMLMADREWDPGMHICTREIIKTYEREAQWDITVLESGLWDEDSMRLFMNGLGFYFRARLLSIYLPV